MSGAIDIKVAEVLPAQHQVNLRVKVMQQIMLGVIDDRDANGDSNSNFQKNLKIAEFLVADSSGCMIVKAVGDHQIHLLQSSLPPSSTTLAIHNARVEMYRGFMRIVVDHIAKGEIIPLTFDDIVIRDSSSHNQQSNNNNSNGTMSGVNGKSITLNLENNMSLIEYQYVPTK
ncbi:11294_t:CDS:2 [Ambispora leptoticha]|uniref:11294_t:CDS:1 n=1 Tax=Ambispora leptoticha TaxID=144679 RepID=A0A9N9I789_9GLOM|nr:11294_t:CDS:2 [Ambispora leptoticha]